METPARRVSSGSKLTRSPSVLTRSPSVHFARRSSAKLAFEDTIDTIILEIRAEQAAANLPSVLPLSAPVCSLENKLGSVERGISIRAEGGPSTPRQFLFTCDVDEDNVESSTDEAGYDQDHDKDDKDDKKRNVATSDQDAVSHCVHSNRVSACLRRLMALLCFLRKNTAVHSGLCSLSKTELKSPTRRVQGEVVTDAFWRTVHSLSAESAVVDVEMQTASDKGETDTWHSLTRASGCSPFFAMCLSAGCFSGRFIHVASKHDAEVTLVDIQLHKSQVLHDRLWIRWVLKSTKRALARVIAEEERVCSPARPFSCPSEPPTLVCS